MIKLFTSKRALGVSSVLLLLATAFWYSPFNTFSASWANEQEEYEEDRDGYDGAAEAAEFEFRRTLDPALGYVPSERLWAAIEKADAAKTLAANGPETGIPLTWTERGPFTDVAGAAANRRPNMDITAGRIRATWVDLKDATQKTVLVASVAGGLWNTTDITQAKPSWKLVDDKLSNLAITGICQSPLGTKDTFYCCTGESFFNGGSVQGVGVFKSVDGGEKWNLMPNSADYKFCTKIACDAAGNVYLGTRDNGFFRADNGNDVWTNIAPNGLIARVSDFEISSTGRLHISLGYNTTSTNVGYRYTDDPSTVANGTWTTPTTPFTYPKAVGNKESTRCELACLNNTVYAVPSNSVGIIAELYKSIDGGVNWTTVALTPTNVTDLNGTGATSQGWYCIGIDIDPSDANNVVVGNLNAIKTTNGGATWSKLSEWVGSTGQYVHADIQSIRWFDNGNKLMFATDGGIFYSSDKGTTIRDRNVGLRIKQFYSCAIHPTSTNYFLAGAQDNGTHQLTQVGLSSSTEVTGGDGAFVAIDKKDPMFQFGAYTYNQYRKSTDGGTTWTSVNIATNKGVFINPWDYDHTNAKIYASTDAGKYLRWDDPRTATQAAYTSTEIPVAALGVGQVSAVTVSPHTNNLIYLGSTETSSGGGAVIKVADAQSDMPTATKISSANMPSGTATVTCVNTGTNDQNLVATYSNYGVGHVWVTTDGGATNWINIDGTAGGKLPDMPVRWAMFAPGSNTEMYIATETGVWGTTAINGAATVWTPHPTFPNVRTDMLAYRASDRTLVAATHGRGLWTATIPTATVLPVSLTYFKGKEVGGFANLSWNTASEDNNKGFDVERSYDGLNFTKIGFVKGVGKSSKPIDYSFVDKTPLSIAQYYRLKQVDTDGKFTYSKTIFINLNGKKIDLVSVSNPFSSALNIVFNQNIDNTATVQLYDLSGRLVYAAPPIKGSTNELNVAIPAQLSNGLYIVKINVDKQQFTKKVMKL